MAVKFSQSAESELTRILGSYPDKQAALLPALYIAQRESGGHLNNDALRYVAEKLDLQPAYVYGVATFYTMYNKQPVGKYLVQVCCNISCSLMGGEQMFNYISKKLGVKEGETTPDNKFTLLKVECLGACGNAPMMQVNDKYYEDLTQEKVDQILDGLK